MTIRRLPQTLINQIAAGEVVERPASAMKELVENALDAGATQITIHMRHGGKSLLRVMDNGKGMTPDELLLCLERHATSKLPEGDLSCIQFLGFRGEALPALASISRLTLTSRTHAPEVTAASSITVEGGVAGSLSPASGAPGTTVEIRDLFFATPARLKFLKTDATEYAHAHDTLMRLAMVNWKVGFTVYHNDKCTVTWPPAASMPERLQSILGAEFLENAVEFESGSGTTLAHVMAGVPTLNRSQGTHQYFFVNGRAVRDKLFTHVTRQAYQDFLARDRHPMVVVYLTVAPEDVDVNVHPAKAEVRFADPQTVRSTIGRALNQALRQGGPHTATDLATALLGYARTIVPLHRPHQNGDQDGAASEGATHPAQPLWQRTSSAPKAFGAGSAATPLFGHEPPPLARNYTAPEAGHMMAAHHATPSADQPLGTPVAQIFNTYILAQAEDGLVLVDQHAAHERLTYEELKYNFHHEGIGRQLLLSPEVVELPAAAATALIHHADLLKNYGLGLEPFGAEGVLVREVPHGVKIGPLTPLLRDIADDLLATEDTHRLEATLLHKLATKACHSSVRAGDTLDVHAMDALLRRLESTPHASQCNHGRPTFIKLRLQDVARLFGR